jgi:hypothetical protein
MRSIAPSAARVRTASDTGISAHAYITKRRAEGKTDNEIRGLLKRYIARELHRTLNIEIAA